MILLDGHSLNAKQIFRPVSFSPELQERDGTATMVLGPEHPQIIAGEWLQDDIEPGAGVVWRVKTIEEDKFTRTRTVQLEHIINSLKDISLFGEIKPQDMGGTASGVSAENAARYLMERQSDWELVEVAYMFTAPYTFNGENIYDGLEIISNSLPESAWYMDTTIYPFQFSIGQKSENVTCEMRKGRNLSALKQTIDRNQMFTRIYPIGYNNLHIDGLYVSQNEGTYGRRDKVITDTSIKDKTLLQRWAEDYLANHCEPVVTITVTGREISKATNVEIDHLQIGTKCRLPIPDLGTVITERITKLKWKDKITDPEDITVTMANNKQDVARIIRQMQTSGSRGSRYGAKTGEEDHAWISDTTDHVYLLAEAFLGHDDDHPVDWSRVAQLGVDGEGISGRVTATEGDMVVAQTAITANENAITLEATRAQTAESGLSGRITVEANKITQIVTAVGDNGEVTAASICLAINDSQESSATINASKIYLLGQTIADTVTANYIATKIANIPSLTVQAVSGNTASFGDLYGGNIKFRVSAGAGYTYTDLKDLFLTNIELSGPVNNVYTLKQHTANDPTGVVIGTFSRATQLSGSWSGRNYAVTASPQGNINIGTVYDGIVPDTSDPVTYEKIGNNHYVKRDYYVYSEDEEGDADKVILHKEVGILANAAYDAGYTDGSASGGSTTLSASWTGGKITVTASPQGETLERLLQANAVTWNGTTATIPISSVYGSSGQYSDGVVFSPTVNVGSKLQTKTITSNGTYTPDSGYIGLSSITVDTQSYETAHVAGSWGTGNNSNVWTVSKTSSGSANNVSMTVTAGVSAQNYNSSTHKYVAYGYAYGDGVQKASSGGSESGLEAYNDGWGAARGKLSVPTSSATNASMTVLWPSSAVGGQGTTSYYVTADNTYAYIRVGSTSGTIVARASHSAYSDGQTAAGLSINGNGTNTVTRALSSSTKSVSITATAGISYNSSTHKYTATAQSKAGSTNMGSASAVSGTEAYDAGVAATVANTWFGYTSTRGSSSDSSFIDISTPSITRYLYAKDRNNSWSRPNITWYLPKAELFTVSSQGSHHQGTLTAGTYICAGYSRGSYGGDDKYSDYTWLVPGSSGASYSFSEMSKGGPVDANSITSVLQGYTMHLVTSGTMGASSQSAYRYLKFSVDGRKHAFYFG